MLGMKFIIGNQELDAEAVSEGTYLSERTGATLRQLTIIFTIQGRNASDKYNSLEKHAYNEGLVSADLEARWELYDVTGSTFAGWDDNLVYTGFWVLRQQDEEASE